MLKSKQQNVWFSGMGIICRKALFETINIYLRNFSSCLHDFFEILVVVASAHTSSPVCTPKYPGTCVYIYIYSIYIIWFMVYPERVEAFFAHSYNENTHARLAYTIIIHNDLYTSQPPTWWKGIRDAVLWIS